MNLYRERLGLPPEETWYFHPLDTLRSWLTPYKAGTTEGKSNPAQEEVILQTIPGHEYDGIRELDNKLPPWWVWGFYATVVWGVIYLVYYHLLISTPLQDRAFAIEMRELDQARLRFVSESKLKVDENSVTILSEAESLDAGRAIYQSKCAACHAGDGGGLVGPNLTDPYWIHGGDIKSIFRTVSNGIPDKGMIAWKDQLNPLQIQQVSSFVTGLQGTSPAVAKAPQGDLWP